MVPTVRHGKLEIGYQVSGTGPPLALFPGVGVGSWSYYRQCPALENDFTVIAMDNRSVGESTRTTEPYTVHDVADDFEAVLDGLGIESAHIMGASFGGLVAQSFGARYPQRTRTLTLLVTHHGGPAVIPLGADAVAAMLDPAPDLTAEQRLRKLVPYSFSPGYPEVHPDVYEEFFARRLANVMGWEEFIVQATAGGSADLTTLTDDVSAPVLILAAEKDRLVPVGNASLLADRYPDSVVKIHPTGGHLVMIEDPQWVNESIRQFCLDHEEVSA